jgi:hypothetical protein
MTVVRSAAKRRTGERHVLRGATKHPVGARSAKGNGLLSLATLDVLLGETAAFLLAAGLPRKRLVAELRTQARRVAAGDRLQRPRAAKVIKEGHENLVEIAGVVHDWHRERRYTDNKSGDPVPLRPSVLRKLIGRRFPRVKIASTLLWMQANGVVTRRRDGLFVPSMGRQVVLKSRRMRAMERTAALVPQYLRVALRNARATDPRDRDVDRDARVFFLPEKYVRLWRAVALERTKAFLEGLDNWLEDHTVPDATGPTVEAAVHSYCYTGEPRSAKHSSTNIGRLEGRVGRPKRASQSSHGG